MEDKEFALFLAGVCGLCLHQRANACGPPLHLEEDEEEWDFDEDPEWVFVEDQESPEDSFYWNEVTSEMRRDPPEGFS